MATKRPLVADTSGTPREIASGDTIDPTVLPASSSAFPVVMLSGETYTVAARTQVPYRRTPTIMAGARITIMAGGVLTQV